MFGRLMPQEGRFFELFDRHAAKLVEGGRELVELMLQPGDIARRADNIALIERAADKIVRETLLLLHRTFITPLDRNEIHALITRQDDVLDLIEDAAHSLLLYDVREPTDEAKSLARLCLEGAEKIKSAVSLLPERGEATKVMALCEEIDRIEGEADRVMRTAMAKLFAGERDALLVIKLKEVYQLLEGVTDRCADVANVIEGIVLERA
jgi:predicted phosphate transport protein (TIGR00153 family)